MATYSPNIPQPTDKPSNSQPLILQNFQAIQDALKANHQDFNSGVDTGKHTVVDFLLQSAPPVADPGNFTMFNLFDTLLGRNELFIINSAGNTDSMTGSVLSTTPSPGNNSDGFTSIPSGIIMKWGNATNIGIGINTLSFPVAADIPAFTQCFNVTVSAYDSNSLNAGFDIVIYTITNTGFTFYSSASGATIGLQYFAIGQ